MYCVSSVTWSTVATTGSMRLCMNLSRILNETQISDMGMYEGSCAGLSGFGSVTTVARRHVFGSLDLRKHAVKNKLTYLAVVFALW